MGGSLQAVKAKLVERQGTGQFKIASSSMQGYRRNMEDSHKIVRSLPYHQHLVYLGLFDGHGGRKVSSFCAKHLHKRIDSIKEDDMSNDQLNAAVLDVDREFCAEFPRLLYQGSTCVFALVDSRPCSNETDSSTKTAQQFHRVIVGHVGDSRCVRGNVDGKEDYVFCTSDHTPKLKLEAQRIYKAGGYISLGRVVSFVSSVF